MSKALKKNFLPVALILIERALQLLLALFALTLLGKHLSVEDLGRLAYAQNLAAVFLSIAFFAGFELLTSKFNRYTRASSIIFSHAIYLRIFFTIICGLICQLFIYLYLDDALIIQLFQILLIGPLLAEPIYTISAWFVAYKFSSYLSIARLLGVISRVLLLYLLIKNIIKIDFNIKTVAWVYSLEALIIALILYLSYNYHRASHFVKSIRWQFRPRIFYLLMQHGALLGVSLMLNYIFLRMDRILLQTSIPAHDLGIYQMAMQLNDAWLNIGSILVAMLAPIYIQNIQNIQKIKSKSSLKLKLKLKLNFLIMKPILMMLIFATIGAASCYFFAPILVDQLLGAKYHQAIPFLQQASWLALPAFSAQILNTCLLYQKSNQKYYYLIISYLIALCLVIFAFATLKMYALWGGAIPPTIQMQILINMVGGAYLIMCIFSSYAIYQLKK